MKCPVCGADLPSGALFCTNCRTRFASPVNEVPIPPSSTMSYKCNRCGRLFPLAQGVPMFCPDCGNQLIAGKTAKPDKKWTPGRFLALGGILLAFVATFCPFFTLSFFGFSENVVLWDSNMKTDAIILCAILAASLILVLLRPKDLGGCMILFGALCIAGALLEFFYNRNKLSNVDGGDFWGEMNLSGMLNPGIGFYLIVLGGIAIIISGFLIRHEIKNSNI